MRFVRLLPERWQKLLHEVLRFGVVGGVNGVINYAVFNALALTVFADGQLKANVVATVVAMCSSYLLNRHWTYRDRPKSAMRREYLLFFLFNATGLAIELGVLAVAKYGLGIEGLLALNVAKTVGVAVATIFRFWSYRTFVFRNTSDMPDTPADPTSGGAVMKTPVPRSGTEPDGQFLADLDPVAELAEAVAELTGSDDGQGHEPDRKAETRGAGDGVPGRTAAVAVSESTTVAGQPLEVEFAETIDVALETELAAELNAGPRRSSAR